MLDIKFIRDNKDIVQQAAENKKIEVKLTQLLDIDQERRNLQKRIDDIKSEQHKANDDIASAEGEQKKTRIALMRKLALEVKDLEKIFQKVDKEFKELLLQVPNVPHEKVPVGKGESDNKELETYGEVPNFDFDPKDHLALGETLKLFDIKEV